MNRFNIEVGHLFFYNWCQLFFFDKFYSICSQFQSNPKPKKKPVFVCECVCEQLRGMPSVQNLYVLSLREPGTLKQTLPGEVNGHSRATSRLSGARIIQSVQLFLLRTVAQPNSSPAHDCACSCGILAFGFASESRHLHLDDAFKRITREKQTEASEPVCSPQNEGWRFQAHLRLWSFFEPI